MSPHAAAKLERVIIHPEKINLPATTNTLIIEGAGGILVPITEDFFVVDLIAKLEAETIIVIRNYLGSINHSLLTIEALKSRNIKIKGIVFNGEPNEMSEKVILHYAQVPVIFRLMNENLIDEETVRSYKEKIDYTLF